MEKLIEKWMGKKGEWSHENQIRQNIVNAIKEMVNARQACFEHGGEIHSKLSKDLGNVMNMLTTIGKKYKLGR